MAGQNCNNSGQAACQRGAGPTCYPGAGEAGGGLVGAHDVDRRDTSADTGSRADVRERKRADERRDLLVRASEALVAGSGHEGVLTALARLAVHSLADCCLIDLVDPDGAVSRIAVAHHDHTTLEIASDPPRDPAQPNGRPRGGPTTVEPRLLVGRTSEQIAARAPDEAQRRILERLAATSAMIVPLVAPGGALGSMLLASARPDRRYDRDDLETASALARLCALGLEHGRLRASAAEALRARDDFLTIAAHELRTPVAGLKSSVELLLRRLEPESPDPACLRRTGALIDTALDHLVTLTEGLIGAARQRRDQPAPPAEPLDLAGLVADVAARFGARLDRRHRLALDLPAEPITVAADADGIARVVEHLLKNAATYSPEGGEIVVSCRHDGDGALLRVSDHGIGLPPGAADAIFEPFGRAANGLRAHLSGPGLGLHVCRGIVERHGGRVWAESEGEGRGAAVSFWIPKRPPAS